MRIWTRAKIGKQKIINYALRYDTTDWPKQKQQQHDDFAEYEMLKKTILAIRQLLNSEHVIITYHAPSFPAGPEM